MPLPLKDLSPKVSLNTSYAPLARPEPPEPPSYEGGWEMGPAGETGVERPQHLPATSPPPAQPGWQRLTRQTRSHAPPLFALHPSFAATRHSFPPPLPLPFPPLRQPPRLRP